MRGYGYDGEGSSRLVSASAPGITASYRYDPFGRRIAKTVNGTTTQYLVDAEGREVGEYDATGHLLRYLVYDKSGAAPVAILDPAGNAAYTQTDRIGSVVAISTTATSAGSSSGPASLAAAYRYLPYGETPSGTLTGTAFGYAGYRWDAETGTYHTASRSYDPRLGRFLQTDPIGQDGGLNLYAYVGGDPANGTDPDGLAPGDGAYRDGNNGTQLGGSQSPGGVGPANNPGSGQCACEGAPGHDAMQNYMDQQVDYGRSPTGLVPAPVLAENLPPPAFDPGSPIFARDPGSFQIACAGACTAPMPGLTLGEGIGTAIGRFFGSLEALLSLSGDTPEQSGYLNHYTTNAGMTGIQSDGSIRPSADGYTYMTPDQYPPVSEKLPPG